MRLTRGVRCVHAVQGSEDGSGAEGQQLPVAGHPGDAQVKVPAKRRRSLHEDMEAAVGDLGTG